MPAELIFDADGEREIHYGVSKGVLFPQTQGKYPKGVVWNGLSNVTTNPSGAEETVIWADNIKYASLPSAEELSVTVEAYMTPPEFNECNGVKVVHGAKFFGQKRRPFGMAWRTELANDTWDENNDAWELHLAWGLKAKPSQQSNKTVNGSPEADPYSYECPSLPVNTPGVGPVSYMTVRSTETHFDVLCKVIYGSSEADARLPLPEEVAKILETGSVSVG